MGAVASKNIQPKKEPLGTSVQDNKRKFYCKKCGQFFDQKEADEHKKAKQAHNCSKLPDFFFPYLENYEFIKFIGSGVFTSVFELKADNQKKALKWIDLKLVFDGPEYETTKKELFANTKYKSEIEIKKIKEMKNVNINRIYDHSWATESDLLIIMEFGKAMVTKASLEQSYEKKTEWFFQICQTVEYLHQEGIVHKKLNPHNILLTENDNIIVCDIGGSQKLLPPEIEKTFIPAEKYLPPEVITQIEAEKEPEFTKSTDIWALGIIYHMMLSKNVNPVAEKKVNFDPAIDNDFDKKLLNLCLERESEKRITIEELIKLQIKKKQDDDEEKRKRQSDQKNFVILEILGHGKFAVVYKAYDKELKQFVVLKVFREKNFQEYNNEQKSLKILNEKEAPIKNDDSKSIKIMGTGGKTTINEKDKNEELKVIKILGAFKNYDESGKANLFLSLEAASADLKSVLSLREKYREMEIFYILKDMIETLEILQNEDFCHGNIKPESVVLFPRKMGEHDSSDDITRNNVFTYKLIDYSISHKNEEPILGMTRLYASPQLKKAYYLNSKTFQEINYFQADMYAMGVLCLKLMGLSNDSVEKIQKDLTKLEEYKDKYPILTNFIKELMGSDDIQNKTWNTFKSKIPQNIKAPYERIFVQSLQFRIIQKFDENLTKKYATIYLNRKESPMAHKYIKNSKNPPISKEEEEKLIQELEKNANNLNDDNCNQIFENPSEYKNEKDKEVTILKRDAGNFKGEFEEEDEEEIEEMTFVKPRRNIE